MAGAYSDQRVGGVLWSGGRGPTPHWRPPDGHCLLMPSSSSGNDAGAASPTTFGSKPTNCRSAQSEKQQAPPTLAHIVFWNHLKPPWPSARAWLTQAGDGTMSEMGGCWEDQPHPKTGPKIWKHLHTICLPRHEKIWQRALFFHVFSIPSDRIKGLTNPGAQRKPIGSIFAWFNLCLRPKSVSCAGKCIKIPIRELWRKMNQLPDGEGMQS